MRVSFYSTFPEAKTLPWQPEERRGLPLFARMSSRREAFPLPPADLRTAQQDTDARPWCAKYKNPNCSEILSRDGIWIRCVCFPTNHSMIRALGFFLFHWLSRSWRCSHQYSCTCRGLAFKIFNPSIMCTSCHNELLDIPDSKDGIPKSDAPGSKMCSSLGNSGGDIKSAILSQFAIKHWH